MKIIDIAANRAGKKRDPLTMLLYGASGSGKTEVIASFPRPLIISDATESGWKTIENMSGDKFYDPTFAPVVWSIESYTDLIAQLVKVPEAIKQQKLLTVGFDSLTFFNDLIIKYLEDQGVGKTKRGDDDMRALYGKLKGLLRQIRIAAHTLGAHVAWTALEASPDENTKMGGPLIGGASAKTYPASCDLFLYQHVRRVTDAKGVRTEFLTHTTQYGAFPARSRFGSKLPPQIKDLTFRKLMHYLYENGRDDTPEDDEAETPGDAGTTPDAGETPDVSSTPILPTVPPTSTAPIRPVTKPAGPVLARRPTLPTAPRR